MTVRFERPRVTEIEQRVHRLLAGQGLGTPCFAFEQLPSTMDVAHELGLQGVPEGACVWAETQGAGRGRAGRAWSSSPGGVYLSLLLRPKRPVTEIPQLALIAGLAAVQAVAQQTGCPATIRWPNDVLLHERKLGGILTEAKTGAGRCLHVVVGLGMNVATAPDDLPDGATCLAQWAPRPPDRFELAAALLCQLERAYRVWNAEGFAPIRPLLLRWVGMFGRVVHVTTARERFEGQAMDIDEEGRLLVRLDAGVVRSVEMGEVSLLR